MTFSKALSFCFFITVQVALIAQGNLNNEWAADEDKFNAETKQVNQFFRRFNGEESERGDRFYPEDRNYRNRKLRRDYIPYLFDNQISVADTTLMAFVNAVTDKNNPQFLGMHANDWCAEVSTEFLYKGKKVTIIIFMKIQAQGQGYEWVIEDLIFSPYKNSFTKDTSANKPFIHPMSHELDFMNLRKAFQSDVNPEAFTERAFEPDYVTLFLYDMKNGNLKYQTVNNVKFHFFTLDQWYIELSKFNRKGMNAGWLISNLVRVNPAQKQQLKNYIYDK
jgi:hypothetical protein